MKVSEEYKLSLYKDYGSLGDKEHIRLVKNMKNGRLGVKKTLRKEQKAVIDFRMNNSSVFFPVLWEAVEDEEEWIIIEEYVEGVTLEDYMMEVPLPEEIAVKFAFQICEALKCLHKNSPMIIYRDLKAENVMITPEESVKLIDFDIARGYQEKKSKDTELLGTAAYAAPEQFGYRQTDNRTDIYAFGVLFNYMLTGKFPTEYVTEGKYNEMVRKCIEIEPQKRYQKVENILDDFFFWESVWGKMPRRKHREDSDYYMLQKSWKLPGFRSGVLWKKITALLGYAYFLYIDLTMEYTNMYGGDLPVNILWFRKVSGLLCDVAALLIVFNYRGISRKIPLYRHRLFVVRILAGIATLFICNYVGAQIRYIIESRFLDWYW